LNQRKAFSKVKPARKLLGWLVVILVLLIMGWIYSIVSEVGLPGLLALLPHAAGSHSQSKLRLIDQPVYKVKRKQEVLGVSVLRIVSKQQPEEFLVLEGVPRPLVDKVYGKPPDLAWANVMAKQLLKLRQVGEGSPDVSVDVQGVKTLNAGVIRQKKRQLPYWQLEVQFKLSNEQAPRAYQAAVVRNLDPTPKNKDEDTLVVGYAQKEAFQKELVADLMNHLRFTAQ